jgi:REP element-mobilizing transposase RayT
MYAMGRQPRIAGENLWYHVFNRGNEKHDIFANDSDRRMFLDLVFSKALELCVDVHAYALMLNHFHLLIMTRLANISRFMKDTQSTYALRFNGRHDRTGHLYGQRFGAIVVDSDNYGDELSRYMHLNHPRAVAGSLKEQLRDLKEYEWSSYLTYAGLEAPTWPVRTDVLLAGFGKTLAEQQDRYARYVKEGLLRYVDPFEHVVGRCILGSDDFVDKMKKRLAQLHRCDRSAESEICRIRACELEDTITTVCEVFAVEPGAIIRPRVHGSAREARRILLWAAAKWCRAKLPLTEIGRRLGGISQGAVRHARDRVEAELKAGGVCARYASAVRARLS